MTAPTWADRSLPLAERVRLALLDPQSIGVSATAHRDELVADVAAAARLARAVWGVPCPGCGATEPDIVVDGETQCSRCGMIGSPVESEEDHG